MLKLRLKRSGRKSSPSYRLVIIEHRARRDGRSIDQVGYYNPITKKQVFDKSKIEKWLSNGVKPSQTVLILLVKAGILQK